MSSLSRFVRGFLFTDRSPSPAMTLRRRTAPHARLMEFLEQRQLLSASLVVTGNTNSISNGQTSPTVNTFTNFSDASTTANAGLGFVTRTYVITNTTGSTINLTGGSNLVNITGANASDFSVVTAPAASIASGASTSFTVQFQPVGAGTRNATISFTDSSSDVPTFSFAVTGRGLNTTNPSSGLEVATTQTGTGTVTAVDGDVLQVSYTGYLLNGTIFDSTAQDGGTPLTFRLDSTANHDFLNNDTNDRSVDVQLIDGWEQGLQGVKAGETRTLIIPSSLGYGVNGHGSIPGNTTLIFEISVSQLGYSPELGVKGNNIDLISGTTTTSTTNGTDFGTITTASATHSFSLLDYSDATLANGTLVDGLTVTGATITGANASDFSIASAGSGQFTVTFKPTAAGTRTAVVHLLSNDLNSPDFTFAVSGNTTATQDLALAMGSTSFPSAIATGVASAVSLPLTVQNIGNAAFAGNTSASLQVFLKDTSTGAMTQLPGPFAGLNVSNLAAGGSKSFSVPVTIPASTPIGTYKLVAVINADNAVAESTSANDTAISTQLINVVAASAVPPFTGVLLSSSLPASPFASQAINGNVTLMVTNATGAVLPKGEQVIMVLVAHNLTTGAETTLYTSGAKSVSALKVGGSVKESLPVKFAPGLPEGNYQLEVKVTPVQAIGQFSNTPAVVATTASGGTLSIAPAAANYDLTGSLVRSTLKGTSARLSGAASVNVTSLGNAPLSKSQQVQIQIIAHPVGVVGTANDVLLKSSPFSVKNWKTGHATTFNVQVKGIAVPAGSYVLEARLITSPALTETNTDNNFLTTTAAGQPLTLTVA